MKRTAPHQSANYFLWVCSTCIQLLNLTHNNRNCKHHSHIRILHFLSIAVYFPGIWIIRIHTRQPLWGLFWHLSCFLTNLHCFHIIYFLCLLRILYWAQNEISDLMVFSNSLYYFAWVRDSSHSCLKYGEFYLCSSFTVLAKQQWDCLVRGRDIWEHGATGDHDPKPGHERKKGRGVGRSQENKGQKTKEIQVTKKAGLYRGGCLGEGQASPWAGEV